MFDKMEDTQSVNHRNKEFKIPVRTSSKRPLSLEDDRDDLNDYLKRERKKLKPKASFDAKFWTQAAKIEQISVRRSEVRKKISLQDFINNGGNEVDWQHTREARELFQQIRAEQTSAKIYERQAEKLDEKKRDKGRSLRSSFMKLFPTSTTGLDIQKAGAGKRDSSKQSNFRSAMIQAYESWYTGPEPFLWCPILGDWMRSSQMVAAHLFGYMHGQQTMDAIFGKTKTPELFSPRNGLMISDVIEEVFDSGFLVIVPQLPDKPTKGQLAGWLVKSPREYKVRIIDSSSREIDHRIRPSCDMRWRDLDNKPLIFRGNFRPAARYLYFHYCLQILRRAWKQPKESKDTLRDEIGKSYWGTPGRYLPKNMLLAFVEQVGHDYSILEGASCNSGDDEVLLAAASAQVKMKDPSKSDGSEDEEDSDDESS